MKVEYKVLGGRVKEVELDEDTTVGELKRNAGLTKHTASVNGAAAQDSTRLNEGDYVTFAEAVKGGI